MNQASPQSLPVIAIVGRTNVGKSSLFNKIVTRRVAIVHEESGITRDRIATAVSWGNKRFLLVDTGGLAFFPGEKTDGAMTQLVLDQLELAIADATKILFVVDVQAGITPLDMEIARLLRVRDREVHVAANKSDNNALATAAVEMTELGFPTITPISCAHSRNIAEMLDTLTDSLPMTDTTDEVDDTGLNLAVVGRPNVGKSSLINRLVSGERTIVSDVPGTTRDAVDVPVILDVDGTPLRLNLIDTAGIKRKRSLKSPVEYFSLDRTERAINRADMIIMVLDACELSNAMDKKICRQVADAGKTCILAANKWDVACKEIKQKNLVAHLQEWLPFLAHAPSFTCCALSGYNIPKILSCVRELEQRTATTIPTSLVNAVIPDILIRQPPPAVRNRRLRIYYSLFRPGVPPTFLMYVNDVRLCPPNYRTYLGHQLRQTFALHGLPVHIELRPHHADQRSNTRRRPARSRRS